MKMRSITSHKRRVLIVFAAAVVLTSAFVVQQAYAAPQPVNPSQNVPSGYVLKCVAATHSGAYQSAKVYGQAYNLPSKWPMRTWGSGRVDVPAKRLKGHTVTLMQGHIVTNGTTSMRCWYYLNGRQLDYYVRYNV